MDATQEEWRPVIGHEGLYEVSSHGRVRSLDRVITRSDGHQMHLRGRLLRPSLARTPDYPVVSVSGRRSARVHNLVLEAFVGPRPPGLVACHNDGNHHNNHVGNLRWDTYSANNFDLVDHGTHWQTLKTECPKGHKYDAVRPEGGRRCRQCQRDANNRCYARRKLRAA